MSRLMSVSMTTDAVLAREKTVTRRKGWLFLKVGDRLTLCRKVQGRRPGEPLERLAEVEVVDVRRERLIRLLQGYDEPVAYGPAEVAREGFPGMGVAEFVRRYFVVAQGMRWSDTVTRIEFRYLDEEAPCRA